MRILFLGDIVGPPGIVFLKKALRPFVAAENIDLVIANGENATNGMGMTPAAYRQIREAGVDLVTLGDHVYKKSDIIDVMQKDDRLSKPANLPPDAPGREFVLCQSKDGVPVAAFSLLGRTFMRPVDCPYRAADRVLQELAGKAKVIVIDMHAEATGDKYLMGHYVKGRVSAVLGTHTHVPTADEHDWTLRQRPGPARGPRAEHGGIIHPLCLRRGHGRPPPGRRNRRSGPGNRQGGCDSPGDAG
jgi:metallophosphoesterase (TIGR00282 family)